MKYMNLTTGVAGLVIAAICAYHEAWLEFWPYFVLGVANIGIFQLKNRKQ